MIACVDSDISIDYFNGISAAAEELSRYEEVVISRITWMEVLVGAPSENLRKMREDFLRHFSIVELDERVARDAISLRQKGPPEIAGCDHLGLGAAKKRFGRNS